MLLLPCEPNLSDLAGKVLSPTITVANSTRYPRLVYLPIGCCYLRHGQACLRVMDLPKKPPAKADTYLDTQSSADAVLEAWLPRLIESNEALMAAIVRLRDLYLAEGPRAEAKEVLVQVRVALERAEMVQKGP